jgi:hypothetical protein
MTAPLGLPVYLRERGSGKQHLTQASLGFLPSSFLNVDFERIALRLDPHCEASPHRLGERVKLKVVGCPKSKVPTHR